MAGMMDKMMVEMTAALSVVQMVEQKVALLVDSLVAG